MEIEITTVERPDATLLRRAVMQAPFFFSSAKLPKVLDLIEQVDAARDGVRQLWCECPLGEHLGGGFRLYPQYPSMAGLTKEYRAIATLDYATCVDLSNCYPTILAWMYPAIAELQDYVNHRDDILKATMEHYDVNRDAAKDLYLRLQNNGGTDAWKIKHAPKYEGSHFEFAIKYHNATNEVANDMIKNHPEMYSKIVQWIDPETKANKPHPDRTLMTFLLQRKERELIDAMRVVPGCTVIAFVHDELIIENVADPTTLINNMNEKVNRIVPGMSCEIKQPGQPTWFKQEKKCWFEKLTVYKPIDLKNHNDWLKPWLKSSLGWHDESNKVEDDAFPDVGSEALRTTVFRPKKAWELGVLLFNGAEVETHLRRHKEKGECDLLAEFKQMDRLIKRLHAKIQMWYYQQFFAVIDKDQGSIVEQAGNDMFVMKYTEFKQKHPEIAAFLTTDKYDMRHVEAIDYCPAGAPPNIINTFRGFSIVPAPVDSMHLGDELKQSVQAGLSWVFRHIRHVIANDDDPTAIFVRNFLAHVFQCRGKLRVFLQVYSKAQQCGKGLFFDDFLSAILGDNFIKPKENLCAPNGLLGRFNWIYQAKLLVVLDENGEFMFNYGAHGSLRSWLSTNRTQFKKEGFSPVEMNDFSSLIALTNDLNSIRIEKKGDARGAPIPVNEGYSMASAEAGAMVDGEPMTIERRKAYFRDGAKYMLSKEIGPFVQRAFVHHLQSIDLSDYDFQSNIPKNSLRADLAEVADADAYLDDFIAAWSTGELYYFYRDAKTMIEPNVTNRLGVTEKNWITAKHMWEAFSAWSKDTHQNTQNCRNVNQLSLKLISCGFVGDFEAKDPTMRLWRKVGTGNVRKYCCNPPPAAPLPPRAAPAPFRARTTRD